MLNISTILRPYQPPTFSVTYPLDGIERALARTAPGTISGLMGESVEEELEVYLHSRRALFSEQLIGNRAVRVYGREMSAHDLSPGGHRRVSNFCNREFRSSILEEPFDEVLEFNERDFRDALVRAYVTTRRNIDPKTAADEMEKFWNALRSVDRKGPLIALAQRTNFNVLIAAWLWRNQSEKYPGVVLFDDPASSQVMCPPQFGPFGARIRSYWEPEDEAEAFQRRADHRDLAGA